MAKNKIKKVIKVKDEEAEMKVKTLAITFLIMIIACIGLYYLTEKVVLKKQQKDNNSEIEVIENTRVILLGNLLSQNNKEYYVLVYDFDDKYKSYFTDLIEGYYNDLNVKLYTSNLKEGLNKPYIGEKSNPEAETIKELKVNGPTLIKVKENKIVKYLEGEPKIKEELSIE